MLMWRSVVSRLVGIGLAVSLATLPAAAAAAGKIWSQPVERMPLAGDAAAAGQPFSAPPGFVVERLFVVPAEELGSWVTLTVDPEGRLIASDQGDKGL
ncbi:MAG: hypothetical protein ACKOCX_00570, partial [Planctomycetota bacterium]